MMSMNCPRAPDWKRLSESNVNQLCFCFLSGLISFAPLFLGMQSNLETRPLRTSLSSSVVFSYSCVASVALVVPLFLDVLFDLYNSASDSPTTEENIKPKSSESESQRFNFLNNFERILILMGVVCLPLVGFYPKDTENLALIYVCSSKCQQMWVGGTVALSLSRYDKEYWTTRSTIFILVTLGLGLTLSPFVDNIFALGDPSTLWVLCDLGTYFLILGACGVFIFNSFRWLVVVYFKAHAWKSFMFCSSRTTQPYLPPKKVDGKTTDHTFFPMIYILCGTFVIILLCALIASNSREEYYNGSNLVQCNLPFLVFVVSISTLSMRMVKYEVVEGLYALIDSKKSYVRYISHELRTPLNTAFLGLKLLTDDLQQSRNPKDQERCDILADVNVACRATVDILNDLLCFDKMESGILIVHKLEVPVISFISDCVGMFSAQAREGDVAISVVNGSPEVVEVGTLFQNQRKDMLLESDIVFMDRFKMDQVLRNLISNALKFTPRGGEVTVTASFVPCETLNSKSLPCRSTEYPSTPATSPVFPGAFPLLARTTSYVGSAAAVVGSVAFTGALNLTSVKTMRSISRSFSTMSKVHVESDLESQSESVKSRMIRQDGKLIIVVKDSGAGMLEDDYKRLFKEIVQFNPEVLQAGGGSGLGLWITKGIVDLHDGKVSVHSPGLGLGSSFTVEVAMTRLIRDPLVPLVHEASDELHLDSLLRSQKFASIIRSQLEEYDTEDKEMEEGDFVALNIAGMERNSGNSENDEKRMSYDKCMVTSPKSSKPKLVFNLLIVDDSALNRKMLLKTFRAAGHNCDEAEDGLKAIVKVQEKMGTSGHYCAILMDFVMPNMDGPTATQEIRALGYNAPIFGLTGNTLDSDITHFLSRGANKVFPKPLDTSNFEMVMADMMAQSCPV